MQYSKILTAMLISPLPLIVAGCLTSPNQKQGSIYEQSVRRAQIEQLKIDQQKKVEQQQIIQNNNRSQRSYVNQSQQPYPVMPPAPRNDANTQVPAQSSQEGEYNRRQDDMNRQATEAAQLEQARQNSLATHASEEARRRERAAEEARQIEQATQESLRTHAEETARRQQAAAAASQVAVSQPVVQPVPVVPALEWEPNSGHLVRAGELVMELKRSKGGISPNHAEMAERIQANMGVSASQTEKILEELGF